MEDIFTYDGNARETYYIFKNGTFFAEIAAGEENEWETRSYEQNQNMPISGY